MKIIETPMLLFQFAVYWLTEWHQRMWKGRGYSIGDSRYRAICVLMIVQMAWIGMLFTFITNVVLAYPVHAHHTSSFEKLYTLASIAVLFAVNWLMLGPRKRVEHYKRIFDHWDQRRCTRWKLCTAFLGGLGIVLFFIGLLVRLKMRAP